jgi:hypothetical protein
VGGGVTACGSVDDKGTPGVSVGVGTPGVSASAKYTKKIR